MTTGCTASRFGEHDYSKPPHNTPQTARPSGTEGACQSMAANAEPWCQHERTYELVLYQIGTHEWVRLLACGPCTAAACRVNDVAWVVGTS